MANPVETDNALWSYAVERYAREGVQARCLALQDGAGVDVVFVFASTWLAARGVSPGVAAPAVARALSVNRTLRDEVLKSVRAGRRVLKSLSLESDDEPVRSIVQRAELAVEALYVSRIHDALVDLPTRQVEGDARGLFGVYLEAEGLTLDEAAEQSFRELVELIHHS